VLIDNTWGTPLYFKPFEHGADLSIQSATKYIVGHADAMMGVVTATKDAWPKLKSTTHDLGQTAGPDDVYLAQRGLRTLAVRLKQHWQTGLDLAEWFLAQPEVEKVLHPAHPSHAGHGLWKRDFKGACGLFGVVMKPLPAEALNAFIDSLELFGLGASWGGFESLIAPYHPQEIRSATKWPYAGTLIRIHAGLEHVDDLRADLESAIRQLRAKA
jgi:cysteine-S-conjugate beta-lyase